MGRNILDMKLWKGFLGIIFLIFTSRAFPNAVFQDQDNFQDEVKFEDIDSNPQKEVRAHELILPIKSSSMLKNLFHFPFYVNYKRDSNPHVRVIKSIKNRDQKLDSHIRVMRSDHDLSSQIRVMRAEPKRSMLEDTKNFKDDDSKESLNIKDESRFSVDVEDADVSSISGQGDQVFTFNDKLGADE